MELTVFHGLWTGTLLVIFIGIVVWAWSGKRKREFDEAANLPFDDDDKPENSGAKS
jgi:cytochrome c oxidase cbb3-type subunit IV